METVEKIKESGAKQAIFEKIASLLWNAKYALEQARASDAGKYKDFTSKVAEAKKLIASAEVFYAALQKMTK